LQGVGRILISKGRRVDGARFLEPEEL